MRQCPGCGEQYTPRRHDQKNCSRECKDAVANREAARARAIYRELYHWAALGKQDGAGRALADASKAMRKWVREDREAGIAPPPLPERLAIEKMWSSYDTRVDELREMLR